MYIGVSAIDLIFYPNFVRTTTKRHFMMNLVISWISRFKIDCNHHHVDKTLNLKASLITEELIPVISDCWNACTKSHPPPPPSSIPQKKKASKKKISKKTPQIKKIFFYC